MLRPGRYFHLQSSGVKKAKINVSEAALSTSIFRYPSAWSLGCFLWRNLPGQFIFISRTWKLSAKQPIWGEADSQSLCPTSPPPQGGRPGHGHGHANVFVVKEGRWEMLKAMVKIEEIVGRGRWAVAIQGHCVHCCPDSCLGSEWA